MWTFETSGGYTCSPKYIAEEMLKRNCLGESDFEIIWLVKDVAKTFPDGIKKVKSNLFTRAYHLSTAQYWIANTRSFFGAKKRKGTTYIQTWHGSISLKPIGKYRGDKFSQMAYIVSKYDSDMIDYVISGSSYCSQMWRDGLIYDGEILEFGTPRCDILMIKKEELYKQLRLEYGLPADAKICLYAPTFRGGSQSTHRSVNSEAITLDFNRLIDALERRFGGKWYVFLRLHPQLAVCMKEFPVADQNEKLIDVSQRDDMAELMAVSDAIITDYSTVIFEGFLTGQPGFIYADDLDEYESDRGKLMFNLDEIPFMVSTNNGELINNIARYDERIYHEKSQQFIQENGIIVDGNASKRVVDFIQNI